MVFSNTIVNITISCRSFVFSQLRSKVSAGLSSVSGLAVPAFDVVSIRSLSFIRFVLALTFINGRRN